MKRIRLKSPYGYLTVSGGGKVPNGREGILTQEFDPTSYNRVLFDGDRFGIYLPAHWFERLDNLKSEDAALAL